MTQHLRLWGVLSTLVSTKHSKYFSHHACAREHLHLYLYGRGFSSKACNYIIIQFCSATYQGRHYSERPLKSLAQPSLPLSLLPSSPPTPPSALPLMLARGAAPSVAASQASPPRLILSAQAAHSCGLHPQHDSRQLFTQPCRPLPVQGPGAGEGSSVAWAAHGGPEEGQEELWRLYQSPRLYYRAFIGMVY